MSKYIVSLILVVACIAASAQIEVLPCQEEQDATLGLDRKNWNGGSTVIHSEGSLHNFDLPSNTFGACKVISNVEVQLTVFSVDQSNMPADCPNINDFFINVYSNCGDLSPASCDVANIIAEFPISPLSNQTLNYSNPPHDLQFDGVFSFDIVPVAATGCSTGQSMLSSGSIVLDYEICVTVTISDGDIDTPVSIQGDLTACPTGTVTLDADMYDQYIWGPNGETSQTISVSPGDYTVTVTDINGCTDTDEISVASLPSSPITLTPLTPTVCEGTTTTLTVTESYPDYLWSTTDGTQSITVGEGTYTVTITDGNNCTNEESITVSTFSPSPVTITPAAPTVCQGSTTTITVTENYAEYQWSTTESTQSIMVGEGTYTVTITDANNCTSEESITVASVPEPNAGSDNSADICNDGSVLDVDALLGPNDAGGTWADVDASGLNLNTNATAVDFSTVAAGIYTFTYTVTATSPCVDDVATVSIEVFDETNPGSDATQEFCTNPGSLDFYLLIGTTDLTGTWTDDDLTGVDLGNPSSVDFSSVTAGTYTFTYTLPANGPCAQGSAVLTITISDNNAGNDNGTSVCDGATIDLTTLLSPDASASGVFVDSDASGGLIGSMFNTTGLAGFSFNFAYLVGTAGSPCGIDEAFLTVNVETSLVAGTGSTVEICGSTFINLFDVLLGEDTGGTFTDLDNSGALNGSSVNTAILSTGIYSYLYTIGDDIICPSSEATVTIDYSESPTIGFDQNQFSLCDSDTTILEALLSGAPTYDVDLDLYNSNDALLLSTNLTSTTNTIDINLVNGASGLSWNIDSLFLLADSSYYLIVSNLADNNCALIPEPDTIFISTASVIFNSIDTSVCGLDTLVIGGVSFFEGNTQYQDTFATIRCDSIVSINVDFLQGDTTLIDTELCFGDSLIVNGTTYNAALPSDTLFFQSSTGCDSLVIIDLTVRPDLATLLDPTLCSSDFLVVNGNTYDSTNPTGIETLSSQQFVGCDSVVTIDLSFAPNAMIDISQTLCPAGSVTVGSEVFDVNNPTGSVTLFGTTCDTLVTVNLSFFPPSDTTLNTTVCSEFSTVINGTTYDNANQSGTEITISSNGCDSTITVAYVFSPAISTTIDDTLCDGESITVNGTIYNAANPSGTELLTAVNGCDSSVVLALQFEPIFNAAESATICDGDSIFLAGMWQFAADTYTDSLTTVDGCDSIIITDLIVNPCLVDISISATDNNCPNDADGTITITIGTAIDLPYQIQWTNNTTGIIDSTTFNTLSTVHTIFGLLSGDYVVSVLDSNGDPLFVESISIQNLSAPMTLTSMVTQSIACAGDSGSYEIMVAGGEAPYALAANGADLGNVSIVTGVVAGSYDLVVTDDLGCTATDMITLQDVDNITATVTTTEASCESIEDGSISIADIAGGTGPYTVALDGVQIDNTGSALLAAGTYSVVITDTNGCTVDFPSTVTIAQSGLLADYTTDYTITLGDSVIVVGTELSTNNSYAWTSTDGSMLSCADCPFPTLSPTQTTVYTVVITDDAGCTQTVNVNVQVDEPAINTDFANIFSPNGDGNNDEFIIDLSNPSIISGVLSIYDRWGNLVHQSSATDRLVWNGTRSGQDVTPGVYLYRLELINIDGESDLTFKDITVVK